MRWTAPKSAKYTVVRLEGVSDFTVNSVTDETKGQGRSNGVKDEYVLPGPRSAGAATTVSATITASKLGSGVVNVIAWGSDQASSVPPANAPSTPCPVVILAR